MAELVERACAKVLSIVEKKFYSIRLVIEKTRPRVPRGLLNALCLGVLRNYRLLSHGLRRCGYRGPVRKNPKGWLALVGAYEALFRRQIDLSRVTEAAKLDPGIARCLRESSPEELVSDLSGTRRLAVLYSLPGWVVEKLAETNPPNGLEALLKSFQEPTPLWIRFNKNKLSREEAAKKLRDEYGIATRPDPVLDDVLEVLEVREGALARLETGLFYVQDRAAALIAHVADSARQVYDLFSAPGNKAAHIAWRAKPLSIVGVEVSPRRARDEKHLVTRQGAWIVDVVLGNALRPPLRLESADLVVVDPDCTSMGRLSHSPETRLFLEETGPGILHRLVPLQQRGLRVAARLARRGTRIIYSTCTLTIDENEDVMKKVAEKEGLTILRAEPFIGVEGRVKGTQRIYPHISRCTGGFVALLLKE